MIDWSDVNLLCEKCTSHCAFMYKSAIHLKEVVKSVPLKLQMSSNNYCLWMNVCKHPLILQYV